MLDHENPIQQVNYLIRFVILNDLHAYESSIIVVLQKCFVLCIKVSYNFHYV